MSDELTDRHESELLRLVEHLRGLVESSVSLNAPLDALTELADAAAALRARAAGYAGERPLPSYRAPVNGDLNSIMPWGVISGPYNPIAAPVSMSIEGDRAYGTVSFGVPYEGPPGGVHGGVVAMVYDQVLAFAAMAHGTPGHTASLTTTYRSITPLHVELRFEAWVERCDGRKIFTRGQCTADGTVVSEAEGMFIRFRPDAFAP